MKKILIIFGTRPEAIKLAPLIKELSKIKGLKTYTCLTGQHKEMIEQVLHIFKIKINYNLKIMKPNQDLFDISAGSLLKIKKVLEAVKPDLLVIQGDTTTAFISTLAAFYKKIKVAHVEAGLRSFNMHHPFPEEINRKFISSIADFNFAPTDSAAGNLIKEGIPESKIFITGNTVIDSVIEAKAIIDQNKVNKSLLKKLKSYMPNSVLDDKFVLITLHRREKFGLEFEKMLTSIKELALETKYNFLFPVHLNPNVRKPVKRLLKGISNIFLLPPLDYLSFIFLMSKCYLLLTDSGGVQEECFIFKKPALVMRDVTERGEAVKAGYTFLTGSNKEFIKKSFYELDIKLKEGYDFFTMQNPFGDGNSAKKIAAIIKENFS